jgi:hypothetical protein
MENHTHTPAQGGKEIFGFSNIKNSSPEVIEGIFGEGFLEVLRTTRKASQV